MWVPCSSCTLHRSIEQPGSAWGGARISGCCSWWGLWQELTASGLFLQPLQFPPTSLSTILTTMETSQRHLVLSAAQICEGCLSPISFLMSLARGTHQRPGPPPTQRTTCRSLSPFPPPSPLSRPPRRAKQKSRSAEEGPIQKKTLFLSREKATLTHGRSLPRSELEGGTRAFLGAQ